MKTTKKWRQELAALEQQRRQLMDQLAAVDHQVQLLFEETTLEEERDLCHLEKTLPDGWRRRGRVLGLAGAVIFFDRMSDLWKFYGRHGTLQNARDVNELSEMVRAPH